MASKKMNIVIAALFIALFLLLNAFTSLLYDIKFYNEQYEQNGAYGRFGKDAALDATRSLHGFLKGEGELSDFYNEKEKSHMEDVKGLIDGVTAMKWLFIGLGIILVFLIYYGEPDSAFRYMGHVFIITAGITLLLLLMGLLMSSSFSSSFLGFHKLVFTNDNWMLDPATDNMINLFPESFFVAFLSRMMVKFLAGGIALGLVGGMLLYFVKKGKLR